MKMFYFPALLSGICLMFCISCKKVATDTNAEIYSENQSQLLSARTSMDLTCSNGPNVALGRPVKSSAVLQNPVRATDGDKTSSLYTGVGSGVQFIQVDLGFSYNISEIKLWHYFADGRTYHDVIVRLSDDSTFSTGVTPVFNNDTDGSAGLGTGSDAEYSETASGKSVPLSTPIKARYVRFYSNGSSGPGGNTAFNHVVELEVYASDIPAQYLFDDFNYTSYADPLISSQGWTIKTGTGFPGPKQGRREWLPANISFISDPDNSSNKLMRLNASFTISKTKGKNDTLASQAQINTTARKFSNGTYAARVKFVDAPVTGTDGAPIVQTFYSISPYTACPAINLNYSELDFEYLPNGGFGQLTTNSMYTTSWRYVSPDPCEAYRSRTYRKDSSYAGWHVLIMVADANNVLFYIDGAPVPNASGSHYPPKELMAIAFNLWFTAATGSNSTYQYDIDWVYHAKNTYLLPCQVMDEVTNLRSKPVYFYDNVSN